MFYLLENISQVKNLGLYAKVFVLLFPKQQVQIKTKRYVAHMFSSDCQGQELSFEFGSSAAVQ